MRLVGLKMTDLIKTKQNTKFNEESKFITNRNAWYNKICKLYNTDQYELAESEAKNFKKKNDIYFIQ